MKYDAAIIKKKGGIRLKIVFKYNKMSPNPEFDTSIQRKNWICLPISDVISEIRKLDLEDLAFEKIITSYTDGVWCLPCGKKVPKAASEKKAVLVAPKRKASEPQQVPSQPKKVVKPSCSTSPSNTYEMPYEMPICRERPSKDDDSYTVCLSKSAVDLTGRHLVAARLGFMDVSIFTGDDIYDRISKCASNKEYVSSTEGLFIWNLTRSAKVYYKKKPRYGMDMTLENLDLEWNKFNILGECMRCGCDHSGSQMAPYCDRCGDKTQEEEHDNDNIEMYARNPTRIQVMKAQEIMTRLRADVKEAIHVDDETKLTTCLSCGDEENLLPEGDCHVYRCCRKCFNYNYIKHTKIESEFSP